MLAETEANPRVHLGANNPPDPYDAHATHVEDLYLEAANWCDGAEIENEAQAAVVERLIDDFKDAITAAEASRDQEKEPHSKLVTEIQEKYYPLLFDGKTRPLGKAVRAKKALLAVKTVWANKVLALQAAEAKRLRDEAAKAAQEAADAHRSAQGDLQATEQAEELIQAASGLLKAATQAEKPAVKGMRTEWVTTLMDPGAALRHYAVDRVEELKAFLLDLARADVRAGKRSLPGFTIVDEKRAV